MRKRAAAGSVSVDATAGVADLLGPFAESPQPTAPRIATSTQPIVRTRASGRRAGESCARPRRLGQYVKGPPRIREWVLGHQPLAGATDESPPPRSNLSAPGRVRKPS